MKNSALFGFLCFLIPIVLISISIFIVGSIDNIFLFSDMRSQYIGFFSYFQEVIKGKETLLYSFNNRLGSNFLMDYYYYLASPLNLLLILFSKKFLIYGITLIFLLKCGLASLTMFIYIKRRYLISNYIGVLLSLCYSLSGFIISFYINMMWLDSVILMPILLLSIYNLVKYEKRIYKITYIISLFLLFFVNYYIFFMCFIFCILYFIYELTETSLDYKKKMLIFIKLTFITFLLAAFLILPILINIINLYTKRGIDYVQLIGIKDYFEMFIKVFLQFFPLSSTSFNISTRYLPNLYCSLFIVFMNIFFFLSNSISKKEKKKAIVIISVFFCYHFYQIV